MSGSLAASSSSPIASTNRADAANESVGKNAHAPSLTTRQSSTPWASRNSSGLIVWVMASPSSGLERLLEPSRSDLTPQTSDGVFMGHDHGDLSEAAEG